MALCMASPQGGTPCALILDSDDQQDKQVKIRLLAGEVDRHGADTVYFVTEVWAAPALSDDDPRASERPTYRSDRAEALVTYLLQREGENLVFTSMFTRAADGAITLLDAGHETMREPTIFDPLLGVWRSWDAETNH